MARLPLKTLKVSYYELGWLMAALSPETHNKMEKEQPALKLRMDILATEAYLDGNKEIATKQIKDMKKELLKVTKTMPTFQPTPAYLDQLRSALKGL